MKRPCSLLTLLAAVLALSACSGQPEAGQGTTSATNWPQHLNAARAPSGHCDADAAQELVGTAVDGQTLARALQLAGADEVRLLAEDAMVTREYKMGRLNVIYDHAQRVHAIHCG